MDHPGLCSIDEQERIYWEKNPRGQAGPDPKRAKFLDDIADATFKVMRARPEFYYDPEINAFAFYALS